MRRCNLHRIIWLPAIFTAAWLALDVYYFSRPPTPRAVDFLGFERDVRRLWAEFHAAVAAPFVAVNAMVNAKALSSMAWGWLPGAWLATQACVTSTLLAAPLHVFGLVLFPGDEKNTGSHGSAAWGTAQDARAAGGLIATGYVGGCILGRLQQKASKKHDSRLRVFRHVLTCAPTGAGKGVGCVIPNSLEYPGSIVCLDVKGENYAVTAAARAKMGQEVFCLDPFAITGRASHRLNWLDAVRLGSEECVSDAASLAETLVLRSGRGDAHWDDAAAHLLQGLLLHVASLAPDECHMGTLRQLLTLPEAALTSKMQQLAALDAAAAAYGVVARAANAFLSKADRERSGVLSTAQRHTAFLDDPRIVRAPSTTDIDLSALKAGRTSLYVVLPPDKLAAYNRFARASLGLAIKALMRQPGQPKHSVLFVLDEDEFAQLGHFAAVEDSIAILRGYGGRFWLLAQDLSQLRAVYPKADSLLSNSVLQAFGTQDYHTARYLSQMLGSQTIRVASQGTSQNSSIGKHSTGESRQESSHGRELLTPDEIRRLPADRVIVLEQGQPPHLLHRLDYHSDPECRGRAQPNPMHASFARTG